MRDPTKAPLAAAIAGAALLCTSVLAQDRTKEAVYTAGDLYARCTAQGENRRLCVTYIQGFSDGNRWLLHDEPVTQARVAHAVCVPNSETIENAADLFVARFRDRRGELHGLSPFRTLSLALAARYPCRQ